MEFTCPKRAACIRAVIPLSSAPFTMSTVVGEVLVNSSCMRDVSPWDAAMMKVVWWVALLVIICACVNISV